MTKPEETEQLQRAFVALGEGNTRPFVALLADDIVWTVIGTTRWSGIYRGKEQLLTKLLVPVNALFAPGSKFYPQRFVSQGDLFVVELRGECMTKRGEPYNNQYCYVCRIAGGKISELTEYADTELFTRALVPNVA